MVLLARHCRWIEHSRHIRINVVSVDMGTQQLQLDRGASFEIVGRLVMKLQLKHAQDAFVTRIRGKIHRL